MKRILLIIMTIMAVMPMQAQYVSVNYDAKTVAAMATAFAAETAAEAYYNEQVQKILSNYTAAEIATAGIFASKYLERKAKTDLGIWDSSTENYYYRRIYSMVSSKIIPKVWTVAGMMLHSPHTALYWGSYLMKICTETKALCMQFESVVTNSQLGFSDIAFLEINPEIASLFKLTESGNKDWKSFLDDLGNIGHNFTKESLKADIEQLYNMGVGLASAGTENMMNRILGGSTFNELFCGNVTAIANTVESSYSFYQSLDKSIGNTLLSMIGGTDNVARLFRLDSYSMTSWISDYLKEQSGQYYTQRWYIYRKNSGKEVIDTYTPPMDDNSIANSDEWTRFASTSEMYMVTAEEYKNAMDNSLKYAGWTEEKLNQLNAANNGYTYQAFLTPCKQILTKKNKIYAVALAFIVEVTKSWDVTDTVYEETFDSYTMDKAALEARLNAMVAEYNENDDEDVFYIGQDEKSYYEATSETKMKGCESVIISVTCNNGSTLMEGNTQYKCGSCGSSLDAHSKECAMKTTITENELDLSELDRLEAEYTEQMKLLIGKMQMLQAELTRINSNLPYVTDEEKVALQTQYDKISEEVTKTMDEYYAVKEKFDDLQQAREEAAEDENDQTDDYYRIPAIMQDCQTAFSLTWDGDGYWNGYTYYRKAKADNINGTLLFQATLKIVRKPKYFLGIKIHRAKLGIEWKLTADYSDTQVVDILTFDNDKSDKEKADEVNKRLSEVAEEYPDCNVTTEYIKSETVEDDSSSDTYHLLWSSDRLEIAREIDSRLTQIYADLVSLEKMMSYKMSIVDVLKGIAPHISDTQGKKMTITEEAHERWIQHAKSLGKLQPYGNR